MKGIVKSMFLEYCSGNVDFMGYDLFQRDASFHHLVVPARSGGPREAWNGAILNKSTSHRYLHLIEPRDPEIYYLINSEMIEQNIKGHLDLVNLRIINDLLQCFEREHCGDTTTAGKKLILEKYTKRYPY